MLSLLLWTALPADTITVKARLDPKGTNEFYVTHRAPLSPSPFQKLPTGSIRAQGWLLTQLKLQRDGFLGNLSEVSRFLDPKDNAWMGATSNPRAGWEEVPYWLRGQVSLAYVLDDKKLKDEVQQWIEGTIASQKEDGWFGPEANRTTKLGTPDLWPNMIMLGALETYYEATGDQRIVTLMNRYVDWLDKLPEEQTIDPKHYWHHHRVSDQLSNLIWLYNMTGNPAIERVAEKFHRRSSNWVDGIPNRHGVNFAQGFREPALFSLFSHDSKLIESTKRNLRDFSRAYGQMPGGMYGADENARPGKDDPRQATESCSVVEMMYSDEMLLQATGDISWADKIEDVAFNWMPTTMTADLRALRYLTGGNHAVSDAPSKSPGIENGGPMYLMDPWDHRCCQHNIGHGWPYMTESLWMATNGNGLAALILCPSTVTAKVGDGTSTTIETVTNYPFTEKIVFNIKPAKAVKFPLTVRVPAWANQATFSLNGKVVSVKPVAGGVVTFDRTWKKGDVVSLNLPMATRVKSWPAHPNSVSVYRGPLAYSLKIKEELKRFGRTDKWPSFEIYPKSAWNYGLAAEPKFTVVKPKAMPTQPWEADAVPVALTTTARRIPEWTLDMYGLVAPLQASPALSKEPLEKITLIPMGAARLRISVFPKATPTGTRWIKPQTAGKSIPATFSHRNWFDSEAALSDKLLPDGSNDDSIPRFTWWDHKGTEEWVAYKFPANRTFQKCRVFWFDDGPRGGCRVPESWKLQVKVVGEWRDVEADGPYPVLKDKWNEVSFKPIGGTEIRLVAKLQKEHSSGILEWEVN